MATLTLTSTQKTIFAAELLAVPAAAAIQNARLFARAEMYASELEKRLLELRDAETALEAAQRGKKVAEISPEYDRKKAN